MSLAGRRSPAWAATVPAAGTILGKALEDVDHGTAAISVLVMSR